MIWGMTYGDIILYCLIALVSIWAAVGFIYLLVDEGVRICDRRRSRKEAKARDHFRKTERYYNDI